MPHQPHILRHGLRAPVFGALREQDRPVARRSRRGNFRGGGFTLVEAMLAATILAFATAALTQAVVAGQMQTYDAIHSGRAVALAEAMMEEILSLDYDDPQGAGAIGPEAGESTRQDYDNIDDYHNHSEAAGAVTDAEANAYPSLYQRFGRGVAVVADTVSVPAFGTTQNGLTVTVTVDEGTGGRSWTVQRFVPAPAPGS